jgi:hypothetical protein
VSALKKSGEFRNFWTVENFGRHLGFAGKIEAQLKAEVAELLARAEAADQADVAEGMSIPEELARREERLAKLAEARAKIEARAKERFEREMAPSWRRGTRRRRRAARSPAADPLQHRPRGRNPRIRST